MKNCMDFNLYSGANVIIFGSYTGNGVYMGAETDKNIYFVARNSLQTLKGKLNGF